MDEQQAAKIVEENAMYLALLDDEDGNDDLKAALFAQMAEARQVLAAAGVFVV
jgi:hypothetical protein